MQSVFKINGQNGIYNSQPMSSSVRYGRNAMDNYKNYINTLKLEEVEFPDIADLATLSQEEFDAKMDLLELSLDKMAKEKLPMLKFECRYMPSSNKIDKQALLGASFEEMGTVEIPTKILNNRIQNNMDEIFPEEDYQMTADMLDINKDGKVDVAEYATSILVEDALSKDSTHFDSKNINGSFNNDGENALYKYHTKSNYEIASAIFKGVYEMYGLDKAKEDFLSNSNNIR